MRGRTIEWEDLKQKSLVQHIVDTSRKISKNAAGRGNSGIIFAPYVPSIFTDEYTMIDVSSEEYKKLQKERHQQEIRKAAEEWE
jgi:hypothetical protein